MQERYVCNCAFLSVLSLYFFADCMFKEKEGMAVSSSNSCGLPEFVRKRKYDLGDRNVTVVVQGINSYFRFDMLHDC